MKLLTRFFLNQSVDGYLQGLSKELDENTNSIRLELNRLEKAGLLASKINGRCKLYSVNTSHPLTSDLTSIVRKVSGIDALVERVIANLPSLEQIWVCGNEGRLAITLSTKVIANLPSLEQIWVCGDLAKGLPSEHIEALLVGADLDRSYIKWLTDKAQSLMGKIITAEVKEVIDAKDVKEGLLVWQKQDEK